MFPQISKKKKKDYVISDNILKQWEQVSHELDGRSKLALKKIPNERLHDFSKVCRIKSIPEFYANYFIYFIQKANDKQQQTAFSEKIQNLLTHKSHFHIINDILKQRQDVIASIRDSLLVVEGFIVMNQGKNVSLNAKGVIDELVKGCESLQKLKELQKRKTEQLVNNIIKARSVTVQLIQKVLQWRKYLDNLGKSQINSKNVIKIIYPHQAINCLLLPFYDLLFIRNSTLKAQINFGKDEEDPFLLKMTKNKKGSQIQDYFFDQLKSDAFNYKDYQNILKKQLPNQQSAQQRQRELERQKLVEKSKAQKIKAQNLREEKLKKLKEQKSQQIRIRHNSSTKDLRDPKQKKDDSIDRGIGYRSSRGGRSEKKIINVDALLKVSAQPIKNAKKEKSILMNSSRAEAQQKQSQAQTVKQKMIFGVYNKRKQKSIIDLSLASQKSQEQKQHKKQEDKNSKEEQLERKKLEKLLKRTEKKADQQAKQFEEKIKIYQQEISILKLSRQAGNKKGKRNISSSQHKRIRTIKQPRQSVISVYSSSIKPKQENASLLSSRLEQQSKAKKNLEMQISELAKQKKKLQKQLEKESMKLSSEGQGFHKKIQKYEQIIANLKNESEQNKQIIREIQMKKNIEDKQTADNLRMYTIKEKQEEFKRKVKAEVEQRQNRKKARAVQLEQEAKLKQAKSLHKSRINSQKSVEKSANTSHQELEIIKTTQTIEIVFEAKNKNRKKNTNRIEQAIQSDSRIINLQKQRELLSRKLQLTAAVKQDKKKLYESKIQERDLRMDRFKDEIKRQRDRNVKLQQNMRQMRKSLHNEIDLNLHRQKAKFQQEREELLSIIEQERQEKSNKDKYLEQQMKFLKEMQKKQLELIDMLNRQKREKREKERIIAEELHQKEELINLMTIEQIKKNIEREVRKQLLEDSDEEDEEDAFLKEQRLKIEQEIENLKLTKYEEIDDMDQQNEKLKQLISRIKGEETKLLEAIKQNIELQSDPQEVNPIDPLPTEPNSQLDQNQEPKSDLPNSSSVNIEMDTSVVLKELQHKTELQFKSEEKKRFNYAQIGNSSNFKQKQKIQNLVQFYLQTPNQMSEHPPPKMDQLQKKQIVDKLTRNSRLANSFQKELFSMHKLPDFVPTVNSPINTHLLNLREVYDDYEADSLRRELFPPLEDQVYNQRQLSVQNQEHPIVTIMDEVNDHARRHPLKKDDKKNFLAINRMRLMLLQDDKKEKQRKIIEQQSRRKIQKQLLQKKRKERDRQIEKQRQLLLQALKEKEKETQKRKQKKRIKVNKEEASLQNKEEATSSLRKTFQNKNADQLREMLINPTRSIRRSQNREQIAALKKQLSENTSKKQEIPSTLPPKIIPTESQPMPSQKQEKQEQYQQDLQDKYSNQQQQQQLVQQQLPKQQQPNVENAILPIAEAPVQEQAQKKEDVQEKERTALKQQVLSLQQQIRSFIDGQQHYEVYQQFIPVEQAENRVQQILDLSSAEIINLNGNATLKNDIALYSTIGLLIAKDMKGIQIGIGIYHKQFQTGEYVCDYLVAHNMLNFLNLVFNLSRFIFQNDKSTSKVQYIFNLQHIQERQTLLHFLEFEKKCKRLGEVYVKSVNLKQRKYVLRRALFEEVKEEALSQNKGIQFKLKLAVYEDLLRQVDEGFKNTCNVNYGSINIILAYYLSKHPHKFDIFRQKFQQELHYQEMLVTALSFKKKEIDIKNFAYSDLNEKQKSEHLNRLQQKFDTAAASGKVGEMKLQLTEKLPISLKRCILTVGYQEINYFTYNPEEAVTRIQSSNSSETGIFLGIIPKYKLLIMEAEEFLTMSSKNVDLTAFFYVKHFIKNIIDVKKENYQKVYLPEVAEDDQSYFGGMSQKVKKSIFLEENFALGWKNSFGNSLIFKPKHSDLVIQKPFIIALLSGTVERAVEGSPICVKLIT